MTHPEKTDPLAATAVTKRDHVRIILRDRHHAWVYWEVGAEGLEASRARLGAFAPRTQLVLRVRSGGPGDAATHRAAGYDVVLNDWVGSRCIVLGPADVPHVCSIGLRTLASTPVFDDIARSNVVVPPRLLPLRADAEPVFVPRPGYDPGADA